MNKSLLQRQKKFFSIKKNFTQHDIENKQLKEENDQLKEKNEQFRNNNVVKDATIKGN